jgi:hypothetical protein
MTSSSNGKGDTTGHRPLTPERKRGKAKAMNKDHRTAMAAGAKGRGG